MKKSSEEYNNDVAKLQREFLKYPSTISIETRALCNADCSFCPYSQIERKGTVLPDEIIDKIISEIGTFPPEHKLNIVLARINETFLDKRWYDVATKLLIAKPNITFGFFSNGTTVTPNNIENLGNLGNVDYLNVSLNYSNKHEHYANMRIDFDRVIRNLDFLHEQKRTGQFKPLVVVSRVGTGDHRDVDFNEFVRQHFPLFRVKVAPKSNWVGNIEVDESFDVPNSPCRQWFQLHVLANGRQAYCCIDAEGDYASGNIHNDSLLDMYNHPDLLAVRRSLPSRADVPVCQSCVLLP